MTQLIEGMTISVAGRALCLLPERAVFIPGIRWLLVADTHWGKCQAFRDAGASLPVGPLMSDLERLRSAAHRLSAERIVVLGDLVHGPSSLARGIDDLVHEWRRTLDCGMGLVPGNHDRVIAGLRGKSMLERWGIELMPGVCEVEGFMLTHAPPTDCDHPTLCGHVHPAIRMPGRGESMKLPCFWLNAACNALVLPAFSSLVDGVCVRAGTADGRWVPVGSKVLAV